MKNKIKLVPLYVWLITIVSYLIPLIFDNAKGLYEILWFMYLIPSFVFSYFWGLRGGTVTALIATLLHVIEELKEYLTDESYNMNNFETIISLAIISFVIAISFGILSDKSKKQQQQP
jgi:thiamine transporter ThiT